MITTTVHEMRETLAVQADELAVQLRLEAETEAALGFMKTVLAQIAEGRAAALRGPNPVDVPDIWTTDPDEFSVIRTYASGRWERITL